MFGLLDTRFISRFVVIVVSVVTEESVGRRVVDALRYFFVGPLKIGSEPLHEVMK